MAFSVTPETSSLHWPIQYAVEPPPLRYETSEPVIETTPQLKRFGNGLDIIQSNPDYKDHLFASMADGLKSPFFAFGPGVMSKLQESIRNSVPVDAMVVKRTTGGLLLTKFYVYGDVFEPEDATSFAKIFQEDRHLRRDIERGIADIIGYQRLRTIDPNDHPAIIEFNTSPYIKPILPVAA